MPAKLRLANKTIWALEDIGAMCRDSRRQLTTAIDQADRFMGSEREETEMTMDLTATLALRAGEYRCYASQWPATAWNGAYVYRVALISTPPLGINFDPTAEPFALACCQRSITEVNPEEHWHWVDVEPSTKNLICEELLELCSDWYVPDEWAYLAISLEQFGPLED